MINLVQTTDFTADLRKQVNILLHDFITEKSENNEEYRNLLETYSKWKIEPRIIGQEHDGVIIFTWNCEECPFAKTFIGSFYLSSNHSKLLLHQEKLLNLVNASINGEETLLAFTTFETVSKLDKNVNNKSECYNTFLAEIDPQSRVFSLNVEWCTYQKVQFLNYSHQGLYYMLFFNHKNSIQLYQFQIEKQENGNVILSEQPTMQQIAGSFIWAKFEMENQRLYYLQLLPQDELEIEAAAVLNIIEFKRYGEPEYIMTMLLPLKFRMDLMKKRSFYNNNHFDTVSCRFFNMEILSEQRGSLYVCYQHSVVENRNTEEESSEDDQSTLSDTSSSHDSILQTSSAASATTCFINYSIVCLHGAYTVNCSTILPSSILDGNYNINFAIFSDYLLVYLPDSFLHLLDIGCEHEPVHSLLIRKNEFLPKVPSNCPIEPIFTNFVDGTQDKDGRVTFFETQSQTTYRLELDAAKVYKLFLASKFQARLSILHACAAHLEHPKLLNKIIERICQDPANIDTSQMLKEYLIVHPYAQMKTVVPALDLKIFPFTTQSSFRGQVERNADGHRDVYLSYKLFKKDLIAQIHKMIRNSLGVFWSNLIKHMEYDEKCRNKRVPLNLFYLAAVDDPERPAIAKATKVGRRNTSFVVVPPTKDDSNLDDQSFRESRNNDDTALDENRKVNENLNRIATDCIVNYVMKIFGEETQIKAENMCRDYMDFRCSSINLLWKVVLKALGYTDEAIRFKELTASVDELELAIFQIMERLKVICDQLCYPKLPRMNDLFCSLAFRCCSRHQFARFLDCHVIRVERTWILRAISELPVNSENTKLILDLIKRLSKPEGYKVLLEWNNPIGNRVLSESISWKVPCDAVMFQNTSFEQAIPNAEQFIPLKTLLDAFKTHGRTSTMFGLMRADKKQNDFLAMSALSDTNSLLQCEQF